MKWPSSQFYCTKLCSQLYSTCTIDLLRHWGNNIIHCSTVWHRNYESWRYCSTSHEMESVVIISLSFFFVHVPLTMTRSNSFQVLYLVCNLLDAPDRTLETVLVHKICQLHDDRTDWSQQWEERVLNLHAAGCLNSLLPNKTKPGNSVTAGSLTLRIRIVGKKLWLWFSSSHLKNLLSMSKESSTNPLHHLMSQGTIYCSSIIPSLGTKAIVKIAKHLLQWFGNCTFF